MLREQSEAVQGQLTQTARSVTPEATKPMSEDEFAKAVSMLCLQERKELVRCIGATH